MILNHHLGSRSSATTGPHLLMPCSWSCSWPWRFLLGLFVEVAACGVAWCPASPQIVSSCSLRSSVPSRFLDYCMARQLLPTDAELGGLDTVERVCTCAGLQPAVWRQFSNTLGGCTQLRVLQHCLNTLSRRLLAAREFPPHAAVSALSQLWRSFRLR